jgi:hypothetical protein
LSALGHSFSTDETPGAVNELKPHLPIEVSEVTDSFKNNSVQNNIRRHPAVLLFNHQYCIP